MFERMKEAIKRKLARNILSICVKYFHIAYYNNHEIGNNTRWFGTKIQKLPLDMWTYQEMIYELRPEIIVETGTADGGSALFFASLFDLLGKGSVVTVDIKGCSVSHPRITKLIGSSTSKEIFKQVEDLVGNKKVMIVLDSDHSKEHVLKEMEMYSKLVPLGSYMVIEDTNVNGHPVAESHGPGPMEAVKEFLKKRKDFIIDTSREKFILTFFPNGFLKRVTQSAEEHI